MSEQNNRIFNKVSSLWKKFRALKRLKKIAIILPIVFVLSIGPIFWGVAHETFRHVGQVFTDILDHIQLNGNDLEIEPDYLDEARRRLSAMGIETQSLGLGGNQNYLERFLEAEIVTNYPYLGGENLQGTVYFQRAKVDGSTKQLEYLAYDEFYQLKERNDMAMYDYFTVDVDDDWTVHVGQNSEAGDFDIEKINYKNMVSKYSMPFEFTIALAYISQNPQFALAVVNLVKESHIVISIAETRVERQVHTVHTYREMIQDYDPNTDSVIRQGPYSHEEELPIQTNVEFRTNVALTSAKTWILNEIIDFQYSEPDPVESDHTSTTSPSYTVATGDNQVVTYTDITDTIWTVTYTQTWTIGQRTVYDKTERFIRLIKRDTASISGSGIVQIAKQCHDLLANNGYYYGRTEKLFLLTLIQILLNLLIVVLM